MVWILKLRQHNRIRASAGFFVRLFGLNRPVKLPQAIVNRSYVSFQLRNERRSDFLMKGP